MSVWMSRQSINRFSCTDSRKYIKYPVKNMVNVFLIVCSVRAQKLSHSFALWARTKWNNIGIESTKLKCHGYQLTTSIGSNSSPFVCLRHSREYVSCTHSLWNVVEEWGDRMKEEVASCKKSPNSKKSFLKIVKKETKNTHSFIGLKEF